MSLKLQRIVQSPALAGDPSVQAFDTEQLPGHVAQALWRASEMGQASQSVVSTGFATLDAALPGGGWPCNTLTEVLQPQPALCEWRLLSPALSQLAAAGGAVFLVAPPKRPHTPGLCKLGIPASSVVWIAADTPAERLWATEQLIQANPRGGAILAWLPQARAEQLRRLQVHAQGCDCPVFVFRPETVQRDASPAPLRVLSTLGADWQLQVRILKRKGVPMDASISVHAVPGTLARFFTPRLMHPSQLLVKMEASHVHALGSAVNRRRLRQLAAH